jgi:hypothetical protein
VLTSPHRRKGVFAPVEKSLYVNYINSAGPFGGNAGSLAQENITSKIWMDVTSAVANVTVSVVIYGVS